MGLWVGRVDIVESGKKMTKINIKFKKRLMFRSTELLQILGFEPDIF